MASFSEFGNDLHTGKRSFDIVGKRKLWYLIAGALILIAVGALLFLTPVVVRTAAGWPDNPGLTPELIGPGDTVTVTVARRDQLMRIPVKLAEEPGKAWRLEIRPDATPQSGHRDPGLDGLRPWYRRELK